MEILKLKDAVRMQNDARGEEEREILKLYENRKKIRPVIWNNHTYIYITSKPQYKPPVIPGRAPHIEFPENSFSPKKISDYLPVHIPTPPTTPLIPHFEEKLPKELFKPEPTFINYQPTTEYPDINRVVDKIKPNRSESVYHKTILNERKLFTKRKEDKEEMRKTDEGKKLKPKYLSRKWTRLTVSSGSTVTLPCRVSEALHHTVRYFLFLFYTSFY